MLQCDESTDVDQCSQLLVFVWFIDGNKTFKEELLLPQELKIILRRSSIINIISQHFGKHEIM